MPGWVRETDGVDGALLNLGQSTIQTVGAKPDGSAWRIGIQDPLGEGTALAQLTQQAARTVDASQAPAIQTEQGSYLGVLETHRPGHEHLRELSALLCPG